MFEKEALELMLDTAKKSQEATLFPELVTDTTRVVSIGGELQELEIPQPLRNHVVNSLDDLVAYCSFALKNEMTAKPTIWHGKDGVVLIYNDDERRERVTFPLSLSSKFSTLQKLQEGKPYFMQPEFIRLLRFELGMDNAKVVSQFRKLNWKLGIETDREVTHGNNRLGKNVIDKVEGVAELPDELTVSVPVYKEAGERAEYVVQCGIEIDTVNQRFQLLPLPDELERIQNLAQESIFARLKDGLAESNAVKEFSVFYGEP